MSESFYYPPQWWKVGDLVVRLENVIYIDEKDNSLVTVGGERICARGDEIKDLLKDPK